MVNSVRTLALLGLLATTQAAAATPYISPEQLLKTAKLEQKLGDSLPLETEFTNELGEKVRLSRYFGKKPVILSFVYFECPNLCTLVLNGLVEAMSKMPLRLGRDYEALTISIDSREGPRLALAKRRSYLARYGIAPEDSKPGVGWHFLTGTMEAIAQAADAAGFHFAYDPISKQFAHPSGFIVLTPQGGFSRYFYGIEFDPRELERALIQARDGRFGAIVREILLSCFHYLPNLGRFSADILEAMRWVGLLFAAGMLAMLVFLFNGEKEDR